MTKDIFMEVWEEVYNDLVDSGKFTESEAQRKAELLAYDKYRDRIADMADFARMKHKDRK